MTEPGLHFVRPEGARPEHLRHAAGQLPVVALRPAARAEGRPVVVQAAWHTRQAARQEWGVGDGGAGAADVLEAPLLLRVRGFREGRGPSKPRQLAATIRFGVAGDVPE